MEKGLTPEQAKKAVAAFHEWLEENYPVAGSLVSSWLTNDKKIIS